MNISLQDFSSYLIEGASRLDLELPEDAIQRLLVHRDLLVRWNKAINLTTVLDPQGMADKLYLDSAILFPYLNTGVDLHDVGTGAGFPGLVIKALRPDIQLTLTESRSKKVSFLKTAAREMGLLDGLDIRWERVNEKQPGVSVLSNEVVSRAAFPPEEWLKIGVRLVSPGGRLWIMAGQPHGEKESEPIWERTISGFGLVLESRIVYRLPFSGRERFLVALRKH
jgi:16S rRNA (guanine527-N7)-methyltransferase